MPEDMLKAHVFWIIDHIHNVYYVSLLCKYISDPSHVLRTKEIQLFDDLSYKEISVKNTK